MRDNWRVGLFSLAVAAFIALMVLVGYAMYQEEVKCKSKGGRMIWGKYDHFCVPKNQFIDLEE